MGLQKVLEILDYPDRNSRVFDLIHRGSRSNCQWVFRPSLVIGNRAVTETTSVGGSDSESCYTQSDSDSDHESGMHQTRRSTDVQSLPSRSTSIAQETKYEIEDWLQSDNPVICITGQSGTGKSTLINYLRFNEKTTKALKLWQPEPWILSHYFWHGDNPLQSNKEGMFRDLIYDILELCRVKKTDLPSWIDEEFPQHSVAELEVILFDLLRKHPSCIFFDGVDIDVLPSILELAAIPGCKVCFTTKRIRENTLRIEHQTYSERVDQTREKLWRPLRDSGLDSGACMDMILKIVKWTGGVYLTLDLACSEILNQIQNGQKLTIAVPKSLSELRLLWLQNDFAAQAAQYYMLALGYEGLMRYSCDDFINLYMNGGLSDDISILEMTLCVRPDLREEISKSGRGLAEELLVRIGLAVQQVCTELLTRCGGCFKIDCNDEDEVEEELTASEFLDSLGSIQDQWEIARMHRTKIKLRPTAASFMSEHCRDILRLAPITNDECWYQITKTFLVLAEKDLIRDLHVNRALTPLNKIGRSDLLGKCQELYRKGILGIPEGCFGSGDRPLPPFLAHAAKSNFRDAVLALVGSQANDVLRHLVDTDGCMVEKSGDIVNLYYDDLARLGDPFQKGVMAIDLWTPPTLRKDRIRIISYESAVARIIKSMIQYAHKTSQEWVQRFSPPEADLEQQTSVAVSVSLRENSISRVRFEDVHYWNSPARRHSSESSPVKDVVYILEVNLQLLAGILRRRYGSSESKGRAKLRALKICRDVGSEMYEVLDVGQESIIILQLVQCMSGEQEGLEFSQQIVKAVAEDDGTRFKRTDNLINSLLEAEAGYKLMDDDAYEIAYAQLAR